MSTVVHVVYLCAHVDNVHRRSDASRLFVLVLSSALRAHCKLDSKSGSLVALLHPHWPSACITDSKDDE
eukprot:4081567-Amphidinium_carterae.1